MSIIISRVSRPTLWIFAVVLIALLSGTESMAQVQLQLKDEPNGFSGQYESNGKKLLVKLHQLGDYSLSRIETLDDKTVAESIRDKDIVTVTLSNQTLTFYLDGRRSNVLSSSDVAKIENFRASAESADIRKLIAEIILQRTKTEASRLKGFVTIAMVLGDGPGSPENFEAKETSKAPTLVQMYYCNRPKTEILRNHKPPGIKNTSNTQSCMGCCGPGCWGCSGCYTAQCYVHDQCTRNYGWSNCMSYLDDAIASMYFYC